MSQSIKILIVDDDSLNRFLLRHMLEQEGDYDCLEAADGQSALALCQTESPDLVLLDVIMPDMDGYTVAPKIKALAIEQYLPIIFITSLEDKATLIRCLDVGGDDFVSKPFDKLVLAAKIKAHTRIRHLGQHIEQQNKRLRQHQLMMEREHTIVEHIFNNVVRRSQQLTHRFSVSASPAAQFCGDVCLHTISPDGGAYYLIGDFTGHGLASAIGVLPVSRTFNALTQQGLAVEQLARFFNRILLDLLPSDMFFAAIIGHVDASGLCHRLWQGGMPSVFLKSADSGDITVYDSAHMALGVLDDEEFEDTCITLTCHADDELLMFTDGLVEVTNAKGEMFSEAGIREVFSTPGVSASDVYDQALHYRHGDTQADDMTVMHFCCAAFQNQVQTCAPGLPVSFSATLLPEQLKRTELVGELTDLICAQDSMTVIKSRVFTVISELLSNALEHGILNLDSSLKNTEEGFARYYRLRASRLAALNEGQINVNARLNLVSRHLILEVTDSGQGFDNISETRASLSDSSYGRGLSLINHLCEQVIFSEAGNAVCVQLSLDEKVN